ncbi:MAG: hypothetical protein RL719_946, partial [Actinomycetota bacterium]
TAVVVSLITHKSIGNGTDTLSGIQNITGSSKNDRLTGDGSDNSIDGGAGLDTVDGGAGTDSLNGGVGNDVLVGSAGNDMLLGGAGADQLLGGEGLDKLAGQDGADQVDAGAGVNACAQDAQDLQTSCQLIVTATMSRIQIIIGHLYGFDGSPVAGLNVNFQFGNYVSEAITGADGAYSIAAPIGQSNLQVMTPMPINVPNVPRTNFVIDQSINITKSGTLDITLPKVHDQVINVVDQNGTPLSNAEVVIESDGWGFVGNCAENVTVTGEIFNNVSPVQCLLSDSIGFQLRLRTDSNGQAHLKMFASKTKLSLKIVSANYVDSNNVNSYVLIKTNNEFDIPVNQTPEQATRTLVITLAH